MKNVTKAAKIANGRSRACEHCPLRPCNQTIIRVCRKSFVDGFKKGGEE